MDSPSSIILGCTVAVVSSAIQSLGITLQRKSHLLVHPHTSNYHHFQRHKRNMWLFGFFLFIVANIFGSLIQITTLPLIILLPLQSIGLIFNSILSCMLLPGEHFTRKLGYGTVVIAIGAFIIAYQGQASSAPEEGRKSFDRVLALLLRRKFLGWFIATFLLIGVLLLANYSISKTMKHLKHRQATILKPVELTSQTAYTDHPQDAMVSPSHSQPMGKFRLYLKLQKALNQYQFIKGVNYGIISGTLTAHTFLFAKSLIDVIIGAILDNGIGHLFLRENFTPYLLLVVMLSIIGFQLTAFNLGLSQILTSILYPLCFLVYNLMNLMNDLMYNSLISDNRMTKTQLSWVIFGLSGVLFGVILISWDSAFGTTTTTPSGCGYSSLECTEEEMLMQQKFPYTSIEESASKHDAENSPASSLETVSSDNLQNFRRQRDLFSSLPRAGKSKRVFSYEQTQLLNSLIT